MLPDTPGIASAMRPPQPVVVVSDGSAVEATAISPRYYQRLESSFPALAPMLGTPIYDGDEISPGETRRGCFLVLFPGATDEVWRNKKSAVLTLNLRNQAPQTITLQ